MVLFKNISKETFKEAFFKSKILFCEQESEFELVTFFLMHFMYDLKNSIN